LGRAELPKILNFDDRVDISLFFRKRPSKDLRYNGA
jgi:hypothetical protein